MLDIKKLLESKVSEIDSETLSEAKVAENLLAAYNSYSKKLTSNLTESRKTVIDDRRKNALQTLELHVEMFPECYSASNKKMIKEALAARPDDEFLSEMSYSAFETELNTPVRYPKNFKQSKPTKMLRRKKRLKEDLLKENTDFVSIGEEVVNILGDFEDTLFSMGGSEDNGELQDIMDQVSRLRSNLRDYIENYNMSSETPSDEIQI